MGTYNKISDVTFIGSGISTSFSIIHFLDIIDYKVSINIIEKYSEFNLGIPYGSRSGFSTLLITSLRNFLIEPELDLFIKWLNENKTWLLEEFEKEGGVLSKEWLLNNKEAILNNEWKELFIPRRFFGCYINIRVNNKIKELEEKGLINVNFISGEVVDVEKNKHSYNIFLEDKTKICSKKVVLSVGSLPINHLWKNETLIEHKNLMFVNNPYKPELRVILDKIKNYINNRNDKETNILIVGANASGLELLYKINDSSEENHNNTNFTFLSTQGRVPDAVIDEERKKEFIPNYLNKLKKEKNITAKLIAEATFKDLDVADQINLGPASIVDVISKYFGVLLEGLDPNELEIFACKYGNEIGKRQRCAGLHYSNVITNLKKQNRFEHISGRFHNLNCDSEDNYSLEYKDTLSKINRIHNKPFHIVINCVGSKNLYHEDIPILYKNLIEKRYCVPNDSKIGFHVNKSLEASKNLHIIGPMLAGNVIENRPVWHVEHCGRIIWISKILAKIIYSDLFQNNENIKKEYTLDVNDFGSDLSIKKYKKILKENWNNNIYYAYEHLKYFESKSDTLKYFVFKINNSTKILMPIIIRQIILNDNESDYFDAITPYGYCGPIYSHDVSESDLEEFWKALDSWYKKNNVVTEFIRFNLNKNHLGYSGLLIGSLINVKGKLHNDFEQHWNCFLPKVRNNYRKAISHKLAIKVFSNKDINDEIINTFFDIYTQTMIRNNAKAVYFFSFDYFKNLILNNLNEFVLVFAFFENIPISTELIIKNEETLYAFLGGTNAEYFHCRPNDFLRVEIIKWAINNEFKYYVLGGGIKDNDGLYKSKKSFFPKDKDVQFCTGRKIINNKIYNKLIREVETDYTDIDNLIQDTNSFFPKYRYHIEEKKDDTFSFDIITEKNDWKCALSKVENYDFYHTYDYHNISKKENERAVLLKYIECDIIICLPLIIRKINNTQFCDATSVYGYAGPLHKNINTNFDNTNFIKVLNIFFNNENIVSVFSRLNPFISYQDKILNKIGEITKLSNVVNIDLTMPPEDQRMAFSKTTKRYINKGNKFFDSKISTDKKDILAFIELYHENMDRVNATKEYYFSNDYFFKFLNCDDFNAEMLFAISKESNTIVSAAIMVKTNNIIQYHLSGTKNDSLSLSPIRFLIDEMRIRATQQNYTYFNLGGGLGNKEDELFSFKSSFSKDFKPFKVWKYIVNKEAYEELVKETDFYIDEKTDFFPLYRV